MQLKCDNLNAVYMYVVDDDDDPESIQSETMRQNGYVRAKMLYTGYEATTLDNETKRVYALFSAPSRLARPPRWRAHLHLHYSDTVARYAAAL